MVGSSLFFVVVGIQYGIVVYAPSIVGLGGVLDFCEARETIQVKGDRLCSCGKDLSIFACGLEHVVIL